MKLSKFAGVVLSCILLTILSFHWALAQFATDQVYVAINNLSDTQSELVYFDVTSIAQILGTESIQPVAGRGVPLNEYSPRTSPDREWLYFVLPSLSPSSDNSLLATLYNLKTEETLPIISGFPQVDNSSIFPASYQPVSWSSDSSRLALVAASAIDAPTDVYVYSISSNSLENITLDNRQQADVIWLDSTKLASAALDCDIQPNCSSSITTYASPNWDEVDTHDLVFPTDFPAFPWLICNLKASPSGLISFLLSCSGDAPDIPKEIFVWNSVADTLTRATNNTYPGFRVPRNGTLNALYDSFWVDDSNLISSVSYFYTGTDINQTVVYHPSTGTTNTLSSLMTDSWVRNPITGQFAYRAYTTTGLEPVNTAIHLATYQNNVLTVNTTLPAGCDLAWSPDGVTLAYTVRGVEQNDCTQPVTVLAFYDVAAATTEQVDVSGYESIIPVGWVDRPIGDIEGHVSLQGRAQAANIELEVKLERGGVFIGEQTVTTDATGNIVVQDIPWGDDYRVWVKYARHLANDLLLDIDEDTETAEFGTLRGGDANNDNLVTLIDFSLLASSFGKVAGQEGYDERADFNGDGMITLPDFSLLASNFGQTGAADPGGSSPQFALLSSGTVDITLYPAVNNVAIGQEFDVTVRVEAGTQLVDGAAAYLTFDPALLEVVSTTAGTTLPTVLTNSSNNTTGRVSFAAGKFSGLPSGTFTLATIRFRALAETASTGINYVTDNPARESIVTYAGASVLNATEPAGVTITDPNLIFRDGFESGNLSAWSSATTDGGDLSVTMSAALVGSYGMQSVIDDNNSLFVTDTTPNAETRYRVRFSFDLNSIESIAGNNHPILIAQTGGSPVRRAIQIDLAWSGNFIVGYNYSIRARTQNDAGTYSAVLSSNISDAPHVIEAEWIKATAAGANNGSLKLWIDGILIGTVSGIDNDQRTVETVQWGTVEGVTNFIRGTYYLDNFESRRD